MEAAETEYQQNGQHASENDEGGQDGDELSAGLATRAYWNGRQSRYGLR